MVVMLCLLTAAATALLVWVIAAERDFARRRLWLSMHGARADAVGGIGLSVIVTEGASAALAEELLSVEYALYEVIFTVDGRRQAELLELLIERYDLFRAGCRPTEGLPARGANALYRSRKRRFRRFVLLDLRQADRTAALNVAAEAAAYDYLLPMRSAERLTCGAVERVVCEVAARTPRPAVLHARAGAGATLYCRTARVAAGGFGGALRQLKPRTVICDPVTVGRRPPRRLRRIGAAVVLATAAAAAVAAPAWWIGAAAAVTLLLAMLAVLRVGQLRRNCG